MELLEEQVVELKIVERANDNTMGKCSKNALKSPLQEQWVFPPDASTAFLAEREDVLEVHQLRTTRRATGALPTSQR